MRQILPVLLIGIIVIAGCGNAITNFEECAAAGKPVMESYPQQCRANGITFVEDVSGREFSCLPEQREAELCAAVYEPVCVTVNIVCVTTPCNPIQQTFPNACEACKNPLVDAYVMGECEK